MRYIAPIVEGHGEVEAVPALLHRVAQAVAFEGTLRINPPIRVKSGSFLNDDDYFRRQVLLAGAKAAQGGGGVLILLDCEDDCPATLGPCLLRKATALRQDVAVIVALAYREYETWFLAAASSLRGVGGLADDLSAPVVTDTVRDAKGWLGHRMNVPYDPIVHQLQFTRKFNLTEARSNRSFDRFYRHISGYLLG